MARILIIDDEDTVRGALFTLLQREGHDVEFAENGNVGIQKFSESTFDLVITDIVMPEKEGIETIKDLRAMSPDVKIIGISGGGRSGNSGFLEMAFRLGANNTLSKPFSRKNLLHAVNDCLKG